MTVSGLNARDNNHAATVGKLQISDSQFSKLSEFVAGKMGLHFTKERRGDLERGIASVAVEFGFDDAESCMQWLLSSSMTRNQIEALAGHLTVGETYFFRDEKTFEIFESHILPELIRSRRQAERRLRVWCAGCATGEEPFSIAILLSKIIPDLKDWHITVLATDINPHFLQKASCGVYNEWSFRNTPQWVKEKYFRRTKENRFEISPQIKKMVTFSYHNLAGDAYPSLSNNTNAMDVIFCRNVLMYFALDSQRKVIRNFHRCLVDDGYLIVSPSETSHVLFSEFTAVNFPGVTFYKKHRAGPCARGAAVQYEEAVPDRLPVSPESGTPAPEIEYKVQPSVSEIIPLSPTVLRLPPHDIYAEALSLYEQGRYAEAEEKINVPFLEKRGEGGDAKTLALLARIYANQGKLSGAALLCRKAVSADKLNPGHHYLLAIILQEQGRAEEAMASLKRALYLDPDFVIAHFVLGNLTGKLGRARESRKHFENALSLSMAYPQEDVLPDSEGMTAGRLVEIITGNRLQRTANVKPG